MQLSRNLQKINSLYSKLEADFQNKYGMGIVMFIPLFIVGLFFATSFIWALFVVNDSSIPVDFDKLKLEVQNYKVKEIDHRTKQLKWDLKGDFANLNSDQSGATVFDPLMSFYEKGKIKYNIQSKIAKIDKADNAFKLLEKVRLSFANKKYTLESGALDFAEANENFTVANNWSLSSAAGYKVRGSKGSIAKDFHSITSFGDAELEKDDMKLSAEKIIMQLEKGKENVLASGHSKLNINEDSTLKANTIDIDKNGEVTAKGKVQVDNNDMHCFANKMELKDTLSGKVAEFTGGHPYILKDGNKIYADIIEYNFSSQELKVKGNVHSS